MVDFGNTQFEGGITPAVVQQAPVVDRSGEVLASGLAGAARTVGAIAGNVFQANQENLGQAALNDFRFNAINIANAVDQGNISVPEARSRLRALYSESLSANPNLGGDLDKLYSSIVGTSSGIGHIALEGNESYQRTQGMIDAAVSAGYINNPNDPEQVARGVGAMQQLASSTNTLALLEANNSISDIQRETGIKSEMRTFAQAGSVWVQNRIQQAEQELEAGADPAEVVASLRADYAANTSYIQGIAQEYESDWVLAPMNTLIENFEARATGAIEAEVYTQMVATEQAKFEVAMRADPELGQLLAATKVLGNDFPGLANMLTGPALRKLQGMMDGTGTDLFDETESTEVNLDLATSRAAEINTMTGDPVAQQEGETLLRSIFRSGATAVDVSGPSEVRSFIENLANPEINTLAVNSGAGVPSQYVEGTRNLIQQYYQNPLLDAVEQRWEGIELALPPASSPSGIVGANTDLGVQFGRPEDFIDVVWNGDGIQFVAKPDYANDIGVKSTVQGLNTGNDSVAQPLNTLIRAIGTVEGTNDFKSIWERDFANRLFGAEPEEVRTDTVNNVSPEHTEEVSTALDALEPFNASATGLIEGGLGDVDPEVARNVLSYAPDASTLTMEVFNNDPQIVQDVVATTAAIDPFRMSQGGSPIAVASGYLGLSEERDEDNITLSRFFRTAAGLDLNPAQTAWCAAFVDGVLHQANLGGGTGKLNARSYLNWGQPVTEPRRGDVVVFSRGDPSGWQGHVGFFEGYDADGNIRVLGGNQSNQVSVQSYSADRLLGFRRANIGGQVAQSFKDGEQTPSTNQSAEPFFGTPNAPGMVEQGNINLNSRPIVRNEDGSIGTEYSMSFNDEGVEVVIPTIFNGKHHTQEEAIQHYYETGEHIGKFQTPEQAEAYANMIHERQQRWYSQFGGNRGVDRAIPTQNDKSQQPEAQEQVNQTVSRFVSNDGSVNSSAPAALRFFAQTIAGSTAPITETDFRHDEIDLLIQAVQRAEEDGRNYLQYGDYGDELDIRTGGTQRALSALTRTPESLANTLGMARFTRNEDGTITITDRYDFAATPEQVERSVQDRGVVQLLFDGFVDNGLIGVGNVLGNLTAPKGAGRDVVIKLPRIGSF